MFDGLSRRQFVKISGGFVVGSATAGSTPLINILTANAQSSIDYSTIPEWVVKDTGYHTGEMVKYQGNIFRASYWAGKEPGIDPGWALYDELYDVTTTNKTGQAKIIAYIPTWRKQEGFDYNNAEIYQSITHGIISFLMFSEMNLGEFEDNSLNDVNAIIKDVVTTAHQKGTYILIALGGATDYGFLNLMTAIGNNATSILLDKAVDNVKTFVESNGLDGVDLDLECWWDKNSDVSKDQGGRQKNDGAHPAGYALTLFAQKLKEAMPDKLISAAVFATSWYGNNYDPNLVNYLDWIGIMTYDLTGSWNQSPVGPHTALRKIRNQEVFTQEQQGSWPISGQGSTNGSDPITDNPILSVEDALWYWSNPFFMNWQGSGQKIPRNKIAAGVPIYGYDFAYKKDPDPLSGQVAPGYKVIRYKDILSQFPNANTATNANIKILGSTPRPSFISASGNYPYAHNIYFETPEMASAKLNFLKQIGAQGVIIWELSNEVWQKGKSIIQTLYKNSGNPQVRPPLSSSNKLTQIIPRDWIGVFDSRSSENTTASVKSLSQHSISIDSEVFNIFSEPQTIAETSGTPTLAAYDDKLFCVHEGGGRDGWLWYTYFDGETWSPDTKLSFGTTGPPALAVYDGKLFCVHEGGREDGWLWYTYFDGETWSPDTKLPNHGVGSRRDGFPSIGLCVYDGKLFCVHEGGREDGWLWSTYFDGKTWSPDQKTGSRTSGGPSLVVSNDNKLWGFHESENEEGRLQHTIFDGNRWFPATTSLLELEKELALGSGLLVQIGVTGTPSMLIVAGMLYAIYQIAGGSGILASFNHESKSSTRTNGSSGARTPVSTALYAGSIFTASQGRKGRLQIRTTTLTEETEEFNLLLPEGRAAAPYSNSSLPRYNTALNISGSNPDNYPVEVMRHHIIPHNRLVAFWNAMVTRGELTSVGGGLLTTIADNIGQYSVDLIPIDRSAVIDLLQRIIDGRIRHNPSAGHHDAFDNLSTVYQWLPGNLFIGPRGGVDDYQRSDDPREEFERNAFVIVGTTAFRDLDRANSSIREYLSSTRNISSGRTAVERISRAVRRKRPYNLNSSNWLLKRKKYRINIPRDEL